MSGRIRRRLLAGAILLMAFGLPAQLVSAADRERGREAVTLFKKAWRSEDFGRLREAALLYGLSADIAEQETGCPRRERDRLVARKFPLYGVTRRRPFLPSYYRGVALGRMGFFKEAATAWRRSIECEGLRGWKQQRRELADEIAGALSEYPEELEAVSGLLTDAGKQLDDFARLRDSAALKDDAALERLEAELRRELARAETELSARSEMPRPTARSPGKSWAGYRELEALLGDLETAVGAFDAVARAGEILASVENEVFRAHLLLEQMLLEEASAAVAPTASRRNKLGSASRSFRLAARARAPAGGGRDSQVCVASPSGRRVESETLYGGGSHALLIGIGEFTDPERGRRWNNLDIGRDLNDLETVLERHGFDTIVRIPDPGDSEPAVEQTSLKQLPKKIDGFLEEAKNAARVVIYYSGYARSFSIVEAAGGYAGEPERTRERLLGFMVPSNVPRVGQPADGRTDDPEVSKWFLDQEEPTSLDLFWTAFRRSDWAVPHTLLILNTGISGTVVPERPSGWRPARPKALERGTYAFLCPQVKRALSYGSVVSIYAAGHTDHEKASSGESSFFSMLKSILEADSPRAYDQCGLFLRADSLGTFLKATGFEGARSNALGSGRMVFRMPGVPVRECPYPRRQPVQAERGQRTTTSTQGSADSSNAGSLSCTQR
ncbi:MAG: hypothetical protein GY769_08840 [bacterium]|nr:hypothetical protein [bacterium]